MCDLGGGGQSHKCLSDLAMCVSIGADLFEHCEKVNCRFFSLFSFSSRMYFVVHVRCETADSIPSFLRQQV